MFAELLDLGEFLETPVRQLSLGQRMRGDLAAAMLYAPAVLYLDEPTIGLDVLAKERIRSFWPRSTATRAPPCILTTHDMADIERLCSRDPDRPRPVIYDGDLTTLKARYAPLPRGGRSSRRTRPGRARSTVAGPQRGRADGKAGCGSTPEIGVAEVIGPSGATTRSPTSRSSTRPRGCARPDLRPARQRRRPGRHMTDPGGMSPGSGGGCGPAQRSPGWPAGACCSTAPVWPSRPRAPGPDLRVVDGLDLGIPTAPPCRSGGVGDIRSRCNWPTCHCRWCSSGR